MHRLPPLRGVCGWDAIYIDPLKQEILKEWEELSAEEKALVKQARAPMTI